MANAVRIDISLASLNQSAVEDVPLVRHLFTADPAGHVFDGQMWLYTSHDQNRRPASVDGPGAFNMRDYHAFSFGGPSEPARDEGVPLSLEDVPWASEMMWAPDVMRDENGFHLFFPARDAQGLFRIGHAQAPDPFGPFVPDEQPLAGSMSIDPAAFVDDDGAAILYFGGLWGGQLELVRDENGESAPIHPTRCALAPLVAPLASDRRSFATPPRMLRIVDEHGDCIREADEHRRFFEGPWVHRRHGVYFLSYSTGTTHRLVYATANSPYGPFVYGGLLLPEVVGWTTHHSIVAWDDEWWLFHHDSSLSGGDTPRRCVKAARLAYRSETRILPVAHGAEAAARATGIALEAEEHARARAALADAPPAPTAEDEVRTLHVADVEPGWPASALRRGRLERSAEAAVARPQRRGAEATQVGATATRRGGITQSTIVLVERPRSAWSGAVGRWFKGRRR